MTDGQTDSDIPGLKRIIIVLHKFQFSIIGSAVELKLITTVISGHVIIKQAIHRNTIF